ncbi:MAG: putative glycolipid-binding domain-containing protein, partial [Candidatus Limnocylindrales bacterium]
WRIGDVAAPQLDGCLDVDLEASSCTNTLPVHRLGLAVGQGADAPAAYVRALDVDVERLEQRYVRIEDDGARRRFDYTAPRFDYNGVLVYDRSGLVLDYPGIAVRGI